MSDSLFGACDHGRLITSIPDAGSGLSAPTRAWLDHPRLGGVILFEHNLEHRDQLKGLCASIRAFRPDLLITVDQEGGRVQRFRGQGFAPLPTPASLGEAFRNHRDEGALQVRHACQAMASQLHDVGVDMSWVPMLDVGRPDNTVLNQRCWGNSLAEVMDIVPVVMEALYEAKHPVIAKHFPGHGGVCEDTHVDVAVDPRSYAELMATDARPFCAWQHACDGWMLAHMQVPQVDPDFPVSLSPRWCELIRRDLSYDGVLISDCVAMQALAPWGGLEDRVEHAVRAGLDAVLLCHHVDAVVNACDRLGPPQNSGSLAGLLSGFRVP